MTDLATPVATRTKGLGRVMAGFFGVQLFVNIANGGAANSLVPNLIARLEPDDKVAVLGLIGAVAAVAAVVTQPLWGVLSDRTRSRLGRRVPWILAGVVGLALSILGLATAGSVVLILGAAVLVSSFYSMISGPISAIVPDRAPVSRRGLFSALGSLGIFVGGLIGDNRAAIADSYAQVDVTGNGFLGGIIGTHFGVNAAPPSVTRSSVLLG